MSQIEAKAFCENEHSAHLIEVDSEEENSAITAEINQRGFPDKKITFWLGITDRQSEGHWVLESSGAPIAYTNWKAGEPNNSHRGGEDCALIDIKEDYWHDVPCGWRSMGDDYTAICEI